jgi:hypothetical protein
MLKIGLSACRCLLCSWGSESDGDHHPASIINLCAAQLCILPSLDHQGVHRGSHGPHAASMVLSFGVAWYSQGFCNHRSEYTKFRYVCIAACEHVLKASPLKCVSLFVHRRASKACLDVGAVPQGARRDNL